MEAVGRGSEAGMDAAILLRHTDFVLGHTAGNSFAWKQSIAGPKQEYSGGHGVCGPQGCTKKRENTHIWSNTNSTTINQTTFLQLHTAGTVTSRVPTEVCGLVYCGTGLLPIFAYAYTCIHIRMSMFAKTHIYICIYMCMCIHICVDMCNNTYIFKYVFTYTHIFI